MEMHTVIQGMVVADQYESISHAVRDCILRGLLAQGADLADLGWVVKQ